HAHAAHAVLAQVMLDLGDDVDGDAAPGPVVLDAHGVVDGGHLVVELDVHHRPDDLHHAPDVFGCHAFLPSCLLICYVLPSQGGHTRRIRDGRSRPPLKPPSHVAALRAPPCST